MSLGSLLGKSRDETDDIKGRNFWFKAGDDSDSFSNISAVSLRSEALLIIPIMSYADTRDAHCSLKVTKSVEVAARDVMTLLDTNLAL